MSSVGSSKLNLTAHHNYYCTADSVVNGDQVKMSGVELEGKVAIITGAASGIGAAAAMEFVRHGAKVGLFC